MQPGTGESFNQGDKFNSSFGSSDDHHRKDFHPSQLQQHSNHNNNGRIVGQSKDDLGKVCCWVIIIIYCKK